MGKFITIRHNTSNDEPGKLWPPDGTVNVFFHFEPQSSSDGANRLVHCSNMLTDKKEDGKLFEFVCTVCDISATSEKNLQMHFRGKKHKKKLKASGATIPDEPVICVPAGPVDNVDKDNQLPDSAKASSSAPTEWNSGWETVTATTDNNTDFGAGTSEWGFLGMSLAAMQKTKNKKKKNKKKQKMALKKMEVNAEAILGGGLDSSETAKAKRAARFANSAHVPPPKKKCIAWSDGKVSSNKTEALLKFLSRKTKSSGSDEGQVKTRPAMINTNAVAVALRLAGQQAIVKKDSPES